MPEQTPKTPKESATKPDALPSVADALTDVIGEETGPTVEEAMAEARQHIEKAPPTAEQVKAAAAGLDLSDPTVAQMIGQLQGEIAKLRGEVASVRSGTSGGDGGVIDAGPGGYPWQYYKRSDRGVMAGWIVIAPGGASPKSGRRDTGSFSHYMAKGMRPLTQYGHVQPPTKELPGAEFVGILRNGGAREFPATQVLAYKWHIKAPVEGIIFPEYDRVKEHVRHFMCEDCDFDQWMLDTDRATAMECFRHLRRNTEDGKHNYSRREATAILADADLPLATGRFAALADELRRADLLGNADALAAKAKVVVDEVAE